MDNNKEYHLKKAIKQLPDYQPNDTVWSNIIATMEFETFLEKNVAQLPQYEPSITVWENIAAQLPIKNRKTISWRWQLSIAATFAVLLIALVGIYQKQQPKFTLQNSTEAHLPTLLAADWEEEAVSYALVEDLCRQYPFFCEQEIVQILKTEITALSAAKLEIEQAMAQYGKQAVFIHQMKKIEQSRATALKQLVAML